jgi:hypothetical protein
MAGRSGGLRKAATVMKKRLRAIALDSRFAEVATDAVQEATG